MSKHHTKKVNGAKAVIPENRDQFIAELKALKTMGEQNGWDDATIRSQILDAVSEVFPDLDMQAGDDSEDSAVNPLAAVADGE